MAGNAMGSKRGWGIAGEQVAGSRSRGSPSQSSRWQVKGAVESAGRVMAKSLVRRKLHLRRPLATGSLLDIGVGPGDSRQRTQIANGRLCLLLGATLRHGQPVARPATQKKHTKHRTCALHVASSMAHTLHPGSMA